MRIEIISIGDELLIGQTVNTNAGWMGDQLINIGVQVEWITTVGDEREHLLQALRIAEDRVDIVLLTGGLGPTHDDVTKKVITEYMDDELVTDEDTLERVKERFRRRNLPMAAINEGQAQVPKSAFVIANEQGTAPGMRLQRENTTFFVMPGVPREMKPMMLNHVLPFIQEKLNGAVVKRLNLMTTGIPESSLYQKLDIDFMEKHVKVAFLPNLSGVKIRLMAQADNVDVAEDKLKTAREHVESRVKEYIYADTEMRLEEAIAGLLDEKSKTVATAESCTGGLVANKLTNIAGSSNWFERGVVSYSNQAKMQLLNVPEDLIDEHGAVSEPVAKAMAEGMRKSAGSDYAISITGIAGPSGGTPDKPVGLTFVAVADAEGTLVEQHNFANDRFGNKERSAQAVLNLLRRRILGAV